MPINLAAVARQGRAAIYHMPPVWVRLAADADAGTEASAPFPADFASSQGDLLAEDGGLIYDRGGTLVIAKADFPAGLTEEKIIEIMVGGETAYANGVPYIVTVGAWVAYNAENVSGTENPNYTEARVNIGPANG